MNETQKMSDGPKVDSIREQLRLLEQLISRLHEITATNKALVDSLVSPEETEQEAIQPSKESDDSVLSLIRIYNNKLASLLSLLSYQNERLSKRL